MDGLRQILAVLAVFGLLAVVVGKLRRAGSSLARPGGPAGWWRAAGGLGSLGGLGKAGRGAARTFERVDRLALTPQHTLHLVRVQGREVLIATHPQGCVVLSPSGLDCGAGSSGRAEDGPSPAVSAAIAPPAIVSPAAGAASLGLA